MELNDEEKNVFKENGIDLTKSAEMLTYNGLVGSFTSNNKLVKTTYAYIKRILMAVAEKRGLKISGNEAFNIDEILMKIIEMPDELSDCNPLSLKEENVINNYIDNKTKNMNADDIEEILSDFEGIGGIVNSLVQFMAKYIDKVSLKIDKLEAEVSGDTVFDENSTDDDWICEEDEYKPDDNSIIKVLDENEVEDDDWIEEDEYDSDGDSIIKVLDENEIEDDDWIEEDEYDSDGDVVIKAVDDEVTDEELIDFIKYINTYPQVMECIAIGKKVSEKLYELFKQAKLEEFYSNKSFAEDFKKIMAHDRKSHKYHFHGTQDLASAETIVSEGLGMMREELSTTSYPEFSMDEVILYCRGLGGEIGREAVVIIDQPIEKDGQDRKIVEPITLGKKIHFSPSGLQSAGRPRYIVDPQYIVGYVDKKNKKIIFNPRYYDYAKLYKDEENKPSEVPYDDER